MARRRRRGRRSRFPVFEVAVLIAALSYLSGAGGGNYFWPVLVIIAITFGALLLWKLFVLNLTGLATSGLEALFKHSLGWLHAVGQQTDVSRTQWSLGLLRRLEWKRFEEVCAELYRLQGYEVTLTKTGADGGVDIVVHAKGSKEPISLVQCKAWNSRQVGVKPIRELRGVLAHRKLPLGVFMTTSAFSEEARAFAVAENLVLIDGETLISEIEKLGPAKQSALLHLATRGDFSTPTCPRCDKKMVLRVGNFPSFWGCRNYPRCKQKFHLAAA